MESDVKLVTPLTPLCRKVLIFMQENDKPYIGAEVTSLTGVKGIHSIMDSLFKRGLVSKEKVFREIENGKGQTIDKQFVEYSLTEFGRLYNV